MDRTERSGRRTSAPTSQVERPCTGIRLCFPSKSTAVVDELPHRVLEVVVRSYTLQVPTALVGFSIGLPPPRSGLLPLSLRCLGAPRLLLCLVSIVFLAFLRPATAISNRIGRVVKQASAPCEARGQKGSSGAWVLSDPERQTTVVRARARSGACNTRCLKYLTSVLPSKRTPSFHCASGVRSFVLTSACFGRSRFVLKYKFSFGGLLPRWQQSVFFPEVSSPSRVPGHATGARSCAEPLNRVGCVWRARTEGAKDKRFFKRVPSVRFVFSLLPKKNQATWLLHPTPPHPFSSLPAPLPTKNASLPSPPSIPPPPPPPTPPLPSSPPHAHPHHRHNHQASRFKRLHNSGDMGFSLCARPWRVASSYCPAEEGGGGAALHPRGREASQGRALHAVLLFGRRESRLGSVSRRLPALHGGHGQRLPLRADTRSSCAADGGHSVGVLSSLGLAGCRAGYRSA